ncbi:MAG: 30S ribosomal protein S6 [Candidatus Marinimicrobia bacterium]|nr:30S ribosomal protein S6 [Candidatus Neomarinimicrobiota bacterium]|tara:strand:+ start:93 stop:419 length:327 start_codon:yes stop_codon:yes gene_type:complete
MALFEHIIMLRQDLSSSDLEDTLNSHEQTLSELQGNVVYKESWGLRSLAYPIKENKKAFYEFMNVEIPQDKIDELNAKLNLNDKIIRYLSIKVKEFCETPTIMSKSKD